MLTSAARQPAVLWECVEEWGRGCVCVCIKVQSPPPLHLLLNQHFTALAYYFTVRLLKHCRLYTHCLPPPPPPMCISLPTKAHTLFNKVNTGKVRLS